ATEARAPRLQKGRSEVGSRTMSSHALAWLDPAGKVFGPPLRRTYKWPRVVVRTRHSPRGKAILYHLLRPLLFMLSAETAHRLVLGMLAAVCHVPGALWLLGYLYRHTDPALRVRAMGLDFENPVGLAAGLDKDAKAFDAFGALGFGMVEVGTLTGVAQPGNQRPRLFRLPGDRALINRMGFNNSGAERAARRLKRRRELGMRLGANVGRTKLVPNDSAIADYVKSTRALAAHVDYLVINVSSPNTPGLRALQDGASLTPLLAAVREAFDGAAPGRRVPL